MVYNLSASANRMPSADFVTVAAAGLLSQQAGSTMAQH